MLLSWECQQNNKSSVSLESLTNNTSREEEGWGFIVKMLTMYFIIHTVYTSFLYHYYGLLRFSQGDLFFHTTVCFSIWDENKLTLFVHIIFFIWNTSQIYQIILEASNYQSNVCTMDCNYLHANLYAKEQMSHDGFDFYLL